jgi:predicted small secreted protein
MKTKIKVLVIVLFSVLITSCGNSSSGSGKSKSSIYGTYSDFSDWNSGISGKVSVNTGSWSYYIKDNGRVIANKGKTKGSQLLDEYGLNKLGYVSGGEVYIYYLNGYYPVGR